MALCGSGTDNEEFCVWALRPALRQDPTPQPPAPPTSPLWLSSPEHASLPGASVCLGVLREWLTGKTRGADLRNLVETAAYSSQGGTSSKEPNCWLCHISDAVSRDVFAYDTAAAEPFDLVEADPCKVHNALPNGLHRPSPENARHVPTVIPASLGKSKAQLKFGPSLILLPQGYSHRDAKKGHVPVSEDAGKLQATCHKRAANRSWQLPDNNRHVPMTEIDKHAHRPLTTALAATTGDTMVDFKPRSKSASQKKPEGLSDSTPKTIIGEESRGSSAEKDSRVKVFSQPTIVSLPSCQKRRLAWTKSGSGDLCVDDSRNISRQNRTPPRMKKSRVYKDTSTFSRSSNQTEIITDRISSSVSSSSLKHPAKERKDTDTRVTAHNSSTIIQSKHEASFHATQTASKESETGSAFILTDSSKATILGGMEGDSEESIKLAARHPTIPASNLLKDANTQYCKLLNNRQTGADATQKARPSLTLPLVNKRTVGINKNPKLSKSSVELFLIGAAKDGWNQRSMPSRNARSATRRSHKNTRICKTSSTRDSCNISNKGSPMITQGSTSRKQEKGVKAITVTKMTNVCTDKRNNDPKSRSAAGNNPTRPAGDGQSESDLTSKTLNREIFDLPPKQAQSETLAKAEDSEISFATILSSTSGPVLSWTQSECEKHISMVTAHNHLAFISHLSGDDLDVCSKSRISQSTIAPFTQYSTVHSVPSSIWSKSRFGKTKSAKTLQTYYKPSLSWNDRCSVQDARYFFVNV